MRGGLTANNCQVMRKLVIQPTEDQLQYLHGILERMDKNFHNDWEQSNHKNNKYWGKLAEIVAADLFKVPRPHPPGEVIKPDRGWDLIIKGHKVDVKTQSSWNGVANCNAKHTRLPKCQFFMFFSHDVTTGEITLRGNQSWFKVKRSPKVEGRFSPMHQVEELFWPLPINDNV